jgi:hypothetical protein
MNSAGSSMTIEFKVQIPFRHRNPDGPTPGQTTFEGTTGDRGAIRGGKRDGGNNCEGRSLEERGEGDADGEKTIDGDSRKEGIGVRPEGQATTQSF